MALAAFAPVLPDSSVASGAAMAVCFTPEEDCVAFAVHAINNAEGKRNRALGRRGSADLD